MEKVINILEAKLVTYNILCIFLVLHINIDNIREFSSCLYMFCCKKNLILMLYISSHLLLYVTLCMCRSDNGLICEAKTCSQLIKILY